MATKYLDYTGLTYLVGKIKDLIDDSSGGEAHITDVTSAFQSSNSRVQILAAYKSGKIINIKVGVLRSAAWSTGSSNEIASTITSLYLPFFEICASNRWGNGAVYATLSEGNSNNQGSLTFRNASGGSIAASSGNYVTVAFTYIYNDGTLS